jgi:uncharacterized protein YlaI
LFIDNDVDESKKLEENEIRYFYCALANSYIDTDILGCLWNMYEHAIYEQALN